MPGGWAQVNGRDDWSLRESRSRVMVQTTDHFFDIKIIWVTQSGTSCENVDINH